MRERVTKTNEKEIALSRECFAIKMTSQGFYIFTEE